MPRAVYDAGATTLTLDADFVDMVAQVPELGRESGEITESDWLDGNIDNYSPPATVISSSSGKPPLEQSATDIRLIGFGVANLHEGNPGAEIPAAFYISTTDNVGSEYDRMYFFASTSGVAGGVKYPTYNEQHFRGTWRNCIANSGAWRIRDDNSDWEPSMFDCISGSFSFIGDSFGATSDMNCHIERCRGGDSCFAGCTAFTGTITSEATFIDCVGGDKCFGQAAEVAGTFIRCSAGDSSFGGNFSVVDTWPQAPANFSGYAEDCTGGAGSFGGSSEPVAHILSGTMVRCSTTDNVLPFNVQGATITDSTLTMLTADMDCLNLTDDDSIITGSEILVNDGGTGVPITASIPVLALVEDCTMNNADVEPTGLGANVTNLSLDPNNTIT
jgi:hypothetical protein